MENTQNGQSKYIGDGDRNARFIDKRDVCERLASLRYVLSVEYDKACNGEERIQFDSMCEHQSIWEKPGDVIKEHWL